LWLGNIWWRRNYFSNQSLCEIGAIVEAVLGGPETMGQVAAGRQLGPLIPVISVRNLAKTSEAAKVAEF
jgi:hypothetical protein